MCGINGLIDFTNPSPEITRNQLVAMNEDIIHRGPDDDGVFIESMDQCNLGIGMRRLSIIDLHSGKQPIFSDDGNQVIVFNGEIYNYPVLRNELIAEGITFKTKSDTEVILQLYLRYGIEGFSRLDGMFAFSIYDRIKNKVFIARDFFGEKPLYFFSKDDKIFWASELKSILRNSGFKFPLSKTGLNLYFRLTYIPAPFTIFKDVFKLQANHLLVIDLSTKKIEQQEIKKPSTTSAEIPSFDKAQAKIRELVEESVDSRSISDVPIGTFLSGGVDSSIVSLCLARCKDHKINTFSIGFDKKGFDERDKSRIVAKLINSNHNEFVLKESDLEENVSTILLNFDEPFADSSALPSYLVANKTSNHVKVALTGDGGDEVFGGYNKYYMGALNQRYTSVLPEWVHKPLKKVISPLLKTKSDKRGFRFKANRLLQAIDYSGSYYWDIISLGFPGETLRPYLRDDYYEESVFDFHMSKSGIERPKNLSEYRTVDLNVSLEGDMLVKVDRTSMLSSLECRAPFLNKKIWDYTLSLPEDYLLKGWDKKHILKKAFEKDFPEGFLDRSKSGFGLPIGDWLRSSLKKELLGFTEDTFLDAQAIFNKRYVKKLISDHLSGKDHTFQTWTFFCFQKWYVHNSPYLC